MSKLVNSLLVVLLLLLPIRPDSSWAANIFKADSRPQIQIMSYNFPLFPYGIRMGNNKERIKAFQGLLEREENLPDILCLQEIWEENSKKRLLKRLKEHYPYRVHDQSWGRLGLGLNSGLVVLSRFPIGDSKILHFESNAGKDKLAKKGVLMTEIILGPGLKLLLFNTHFQAGGKLDQKGRPDEKLRSKMQQGLEMRNFISLMASLYPHDYRILAGDLNLSPNDPRLSSYYQRVLGQFPSARETFDPAAEMGLEGTSWDPGEEEHRIDHIWDLKGNLSGYSYVSDFFGPDISNHRAVIGRFELH